MYNLSRSYFSEENFLSYSSEWLSVQVGVFPKAKTGKHKGEIQTHRRRKNGKQRNPNKKKPRNQNSQKVHLKTSCNKSLGRLKSRKILFDGKAVLLVVPWVRVDLDLFISLLFHLRFS